jgi:hypothetical protein
MSPVLVAVQGVVFAAWAFLMLRTLFRLRRRAIRRSGRMFPGILDTLERYRALALLPDDRSDRRLLLASTLILFALILLGVWLREG